jgi:prepilin-type N-terminal cleavage/methylation domain-containing protein
MNPRRVARNGRRSGFTLLEVVMALLVFLVLAVPLGYMTVWTARGKSWARELDDAVAVAREEWGSVRRIPPKLLRDSVREAKVGEHVYRVVRTVSDTLPNGVAVDTTQVGESKRPPVRPGVRVCVVRARGLLDISDTVRCFGWRVPLVEIQP